MVKANIDAKKCIGCGLCAQLSPAVFERAGAKAKVKKKDVTQDELAGATKAAESCPAQAITVK